MRSLLFWPAASIAICLVSVANLAPKLLEHHQLNMRVIQGDQHILDLEEERQHLKKSLEIIAHNPEFKHKLQLQYLGIKPREPKPTEVKVSNKKAKQNKIVVSQPEAVKFKDAELELEQFVLRPVSSMRLPLPAEPWYMEAVIWLCKSEVTQHINLWGIVLLGASFVLLHPGKIPSLWEICSALWKNFTSRYGSSTN